MPNMLFILSVCTMVLGGAMTAINLDAEMGWGFGREASGALGIVVALVTAMIVACMAMRRSSR